MIIEYPNGDRDSILFKINGKPKFPSGVIESFNNKIQFIESAIAITDLSAMRSLHFKKLRGNRKGEYSIRLNDQFRLIVKVAETNGQTKIIIMGVEDYH